MGKVIRLESDRDVFQRALLALQDVKYKHIIVIVSAENHLEELYFYGHPAKVYQLTALAQAHIVQNYPLMESGSDLMDDDEEE